MPDKFIYKPHQMLDWLKDNTPADDHVTVDLLRVAYDLATDCLAGASASTIRDRKAAMWEVLYIWNDADHAKREKHDAER